MYNGGSGTETLSSGSQQASYSANGWNLDTAEDFAVKVDFHYSDVSAAEGWIGMSVGDDANYVSISSGSDGGQSYFYYEAVVDGSVVSEREPRTSDDGTLYISYDSASKRFLSEPHRIRQRECLRLAVRPIRHRVSGECLFMRRLAAVLPELLSTRARRIWITLRWPEAGLLGWPPVTDIDSNGFIEIDDLEIMCENWLDSGEGDIDNNGDVDFRDFAEFGLAW